jgi:hypothetical protein
MSRMPYGMRGGSVDPYRRDELADTQALFQKFLLTSRARQVC